MQPALSSGNRRLEDLARLARWLADRQRVDIFHAALDLAPHRILIVEEARVVETDEELAVGAVRIAGARHGAGAADMRLARKLRVEIGEVASAAAGSGRVAALRHEARDDAVEQDAVIEAVLRQAGDPLDMAGRQVWTQLDDDIAAGRKGEGQGFGVGHDFVLEMENVAAI